MEEKEVRLTYNRKDIEAIYFGDGHDRLLFGPHTRRQTISLLIALAVFPFSLVYATGKMEWLGIAIALILFIVCYDFFRVYGQAVRWKRSVVAFLDRNEKFQSHTIRYNDTSFTLQQDEEITKADWHLVKLAVITPTYISLKAEHTDFFIPRCAVTENAYQELADTIKARVPEVQVM